MAVSSINQDPIVNIEWYSFLNMQDTSFVINSFGNVVDVLIYTTHSRDAFFCGGVGKFIVVIQVYIARIKDIETSVGGEYVACGSCGMAGTFCKR